MVVNPSASASGINERVQRQSCSNCRRPLKVCFCPALPAQPLTLAGKVIVLQHPHEKRRSTATVPLLQHCLENCVVISGRHLKQLWQPQLEAAVQEAALGAYPLYVMFPGSGAMDLATMATSCCQTPCPGASAAAAAATAQPPLHQRQVPGGEADLGSTARVAATACAAGFRMEAGEASTAADPASAADAAGGCPSVGFGDASPRSSDSCSPHDGSAVHAAPPAGPPGSGTCRYVLVAIDGTWQHAKEMFQELRPLLLAPGGPGLQVQLAAPFLGQTEGRPHPPASCPCRTDAPSEGVGAEGEGEHDAAAAAAAAAAAGRGGDPSPTKHSASPPSPPAAAAAAAGLQRGEPSSSTPAAAAAAAAAGVGPSPAATTILSPAEMAPAAEEASPSVPPLATGTSRATATAAAATAPFLETSKAAVAPSLPPHAEGLQLQAPHHAACEAGTAAAAMAASGGEGGEREAPREEAPGQQPYLLLMEPMPGCVTTCEAVARALGVLESDGARVQEAVLKPLALVAAFQAQWDPAVHARLLGEGAQYSTGRRRFGMGRRQQCAAPHPTSTHITARP